MMLCLTIIDELLGCECVVFVVVVLLGYLVLVSFVCCYDLSYVFGVVDIFVLYSFICASNSNLFKDVENIPKNPAKSMPATLA